MKLEMPMIVGEGIGAGMLFGIDQRDGKLHLCRSDHNVVPVGMARRGFTEGETIDIAKYQPDTFITNGLAS